MNNDRVEIKKEHKSNLRTGRLNQLEHSWLQRTLKQFRRQVVFEKETDNLPRSFRCGTIGSIGCSGS